MKVPEEYFKVSEWLASVPIHSDLPQWWETVAGFISAQQREIERLEAEVDAALAYGYEYHKHPSMRGSSLHACRLSWRDRK